MTHLKIPDLLAQEPPSWRKINPFFKGEGLEVRGEGVK
jgi:hypothetical protein